MPLTYTSIDSALSGISDNVNAVCPAVAVNESTFPDLKLDSSAEVPTEFAGGV